MTGTFVLEVNFAGDGTTFVDITDHLTSLECMRGHAGLLDGSAIAGTLTAQLMNEDGRFSSYNASGPYFGDLLPGRKVRFKSTAPTAATLWTGFLQGPPQPTVGAETIPRATLNAVGALAILGNPNTKINPPTLTGVNTDDVLDAILDAALWPVGARNLDVGVVPIARWIAVNAGALDKMQEMEETEFGRLFEDLNWGVGFENRYHRTITSASTTSQATFSDALGATLSYTAISQDDPLREIFNDITAQVQPYTVGPLAVLWSLTDVVYLPPGGSVTYIATYANPAVDAWSTPVVGTDIVHDSSVADGDLAVAVTKAATTMPIKITNNHATSGTYLSLVQAQGTPVVAGDPYSVNSFDAASQADYQLRSYPLPSPWYSNAPYAQAACDYIIDRQKQPRPIDTIEIVSGQYSTYFAQGVGRAFSDRITLVANNRSKLGIVSNDAYIEAIHHKVSSKSLLRTTWDLSPADPAGRYFVLDVSELDSADPLAF